MIPAASVSHHVNLTFHHNCSPRESVYLMRMHLCKRNSPVFPMHNGDIKVSGEWKGRDAGLGGNSSCGAHRPLSHLINTSGPHSSWTSPFPHESHPSLSRLTLFSILPLCRTRRMHFLIIIPVFILWLFRANVSGNMTNKIKWYIKLTTTSRQHLKWIKSIKQNHSLSSVA